MTNSRHVLTAYLAGAPVPPNDVRAAVAVLSYALEDLYRTVERFIHEGHATVESFTRLNAGLYEADGLLNDRLAHYTPAAEMLPAFLAGRASAHEKFSETTS